MPSKSPVLVGRLEIVGGMPAFERGSTRTRHEAGAGPSRASRALAGMAPDTACAPSSEAVAKLGKADFSARPLRKVVGQVWRFRARSARRVSFVVCLRGCRAARGA